MTSKYFDLLLEKTETKSGYIRGPEREDLIKWVAKAWKEIEMDTICNAFQKARLLEPLPSLQIIPDYSNEVNTVVEELENMDYDDPYLDVFEQHYLSNSELISQQD